MSALESDFMAAPTEQKAGSQTCSPREALPAVASTAETPVDNGGEIQ